MITLSPTVIVSSVLYAFALGLSPASALMLPLATLSFCLFTGLFGLAANLLLPKLDWKNEIVPIKQGGASLVAMLGGMLASGVFGGIAALLALLLPAAVALLFSTVLMLTVSAGIAAFVFKNGVAIFESLS